MNDKSDQIDLGKPSGFKALVGYRTPVWEEGHAVFEVEITERHTNSSGFLHGGVYMTILDAAMGHASTWCSIEGNVRRCVTLSLTSNFVSIARTRIVRAEAWVRGVENGVATCRGEVRDANDTICVSGNGSYLYMRGCENVEGIPAEPKP